MRSSMIITGLVTLGAFLPDAADAQERYAVGGDHVAIYNLAGAVQVHGTSGGQVTVDVTRGGRDAGQLRVEHGAIDGRQTLRVLYSSDRVVYGTGRGNTQLRVRGDGTWGSGMPLLSGARSVRVSGSGSGMEAHADLRVGVPRGQRVEIYLAVGRMTAENVAGTIRLDTHSGSVSASNMSGSLLVDTGSGAVEVTGMEGDLSIDTGSGSVHVANVAGASLSIDTGSGRVTAEQVTAERVLIDTGSGSIDLRRASARDVRLDTGSGSVNVELSGALDRLVIDTGSGGVTAALPRDLDARVTVSTGSGGIGVDLPLNITKQRRGELEAVAGQGRGRVLIDTGSGGVRLRAM